MSYYIFSFYTRNSALRFYDDASTRCNCKVVNTPFQVSNSCGLSVMTHDYDSAYAVLSEGKYKLLGVFYFDGEYKQIL